MKLAFLIFKYFPYGGVQRDMLRIAQDCVAMGHQVTVFTGAWRGEVPDEISIQRLPSRGWLNHQKHHALIKQMHAALQQQHFDRIVGFNRMPGLDVYFAADPCYAERMQYEPWYKKISGRYRFFQGCEEAVFGTAASTRILLLNQRDQAIFQRWYATPDARFHLIPPHIPQHRFATLPDQDYRAYVRQTFNLPSDTRVLLTVGSAFKRKGVDRAMAAMAALPSAVRAKTVLLAVGEFESGSDVHGLARQLGVETQCIIAGGRPDVAALMLGCDLMLHAARSELAGIVLIEAMTAGLPLLVTDVCGYAHYIRDAGAGIVLPSPFQQSDMNQALALMLQQLPASQWSSQARAYIARMQQSGTAHHEARIITA